MDVLARRAYWLRRTRRAGYVELAVACALFAGAVLLGNALSARQSWLDAHGTRVDATVLSVSCRHGARSCSPSAVVGFDTASRSPVQARIWLNEGTPVQEGQTLEVEYDAANPSRAQPVSHDLRSLPPTELLVVLALVASAGLFCRGAYMLQVARRSRRLLAAEGRAGRGRFVTVGRRSRYRLVLETGESVWVRGLRRGLSPPAWSSDMPVTVYGNAHHRAPVVVEDPTTGNLLLGKARRIC